MPKPIKILHVFSQMGRGGGELRTLEILRNIDRRQFRSHFCAISGREGELDGEIRSLGGEVHLLRRDLVRFPRRFRGLLRRHRFDVVHTHLLNYSGVILRLAAQSDVPIRAALFRSSHDGKASSLGRRMYRRLMRHWIDRYATNVQAVSQGAMEAVWGPHWKSDPRCEVIYDGVEPAPFEEETDAESVRREFALPSRAPLCIHVGRMARPKNHLRVLSIFAEVLRRRPDARLLLVGRGGNQIERDVRRRIAAPGIAGRVVLCGQRTDVLIFPSLWEGLPGAVLEACAAGVPVLASDLPGVREIAARLPQVRYLPLEDDDANWAETAIAILESTDAPSARRRAREMFVGSIFTIDHCTRRHCRVWQNLPPQRSQPLTGETPVPRSISRMRKRVARASRP